METYSSWQTFFLHLIFFFCSDSQAENSFHQLELAGAAPLPEHRGHRGPAKGLCHRVPSTPPSRDTRGEVGDTRGPVPPSRAVRWPRRSPAPALSSPCCGFGVSGAGDGAEPPLRARREELPAEERRFKQIRSIKASFVSIPAPEN